MARVAHYTDNPAVMALDVREYLVGQRNLAEGRHRRLEEALEGCTAERWREPEHYVAKKRESLARDIKQAKEELQLLERRVADMDAIHAALTAPPKEAA